MPFIPETTLAIDSVWLQDALSSAVPGVRVRDVQLLERHEVTNSHARISVDYDEAAGAPGVLFCKLLPTDPEHRAAIVATGMGLQEARFYEKLAPNVDIRVPKVYVARSEAESGAFILVMQDLVTSGCTVSDGVECVSVDAASVALEDLARLHVRFEDPARRKAEAPWVLPPAPASDYGTVRLQYGLDHHRDRLTPAFAAMAELYVAKRDALHAAWATGPTTVIHGDAHIGNLFEDDGRVGFLDWGIIQASTPLRDVGYFLCMALSTSDRRAHERDLWRHYLEVRTALGGAAIGWDEAWTAHRVHAAYLAPASCQIVTFPEVTNEGRQRFADAFLARASAAIEDLEAHAAVSAAASL